MAEMPSMTALWLCRSAQTSAAVLLGGTAALRLLAVGTGFDPEWRDWRRLSWASALTLLVSGLFQLGLTAAEMSGESLIRALTDGTLRTVLGSTRFGAVWCVRMTLLGGWFFVGRIALVWQGADSRLTVARELAGTLLAAALLGSLVFAGHAQASEKSVWLLPVAVCHVVAAGAWPGSLLPLVLLLSRAWREPGCRSASVTITRRFSRLSVAVVGVLALSGLLNGIGMIRTFAALWTSVYGQLVLCKVLLFTGMIGVGAMNRRLVGRMDAGDAAGTLRRLWRNVAWESALAISVLLATEALAMSAPPM